ncbi:hypothetical protein Droror1_Dr00021451 [Drosera rotundifolia]
MYDMNRKHDVYDMNRNGDSCMQQRNVTYHFLHWKKGTPFAEDQGIYNRLTWWEQIDNGKQLTLLLSVCMDSLCLLMWKSRQLLDCLAHDRLPASYAVLQHTRGSHPGDPQVPSHAQGQDFRHQWRSVSPRRKGRKHRLFLFPTLLTRNGNPSMHPCMYNPCIENQRETVS